MALQRFASFVRLTGTLRQFATKIQAEIDPTVSKDLKRRSYRRHIGQTESRKVIKLPEHIEDAIRIILREENYDDLIKRGSALLRHLHGRHVPLEDDEKRLLSKQEEEKMELKLMKKQAEVSPEQYEKLKEKAQSSLILRKKAKENLWQPTEYTAEKCFQYLLLRGPADYAVLKVILSDIAKRDPHFQPRSLLDFGSGVGTVSWVTEQLWNTCKELYNIDTCRTMRDLAGLVLKRGNPQKELSPSIYFRGFLPSSLKYTHDIVVSAYTLFELPSKKQRLETLLTLWNKTDYYLVIVEEGTYAGYRLVIEARDFILEMSEREKAVAGGTGAHVFSPCPHDRVCPKYLTSRYPCNFEVSYFQHPNVQISQAMRERYSYVVIKRGTRTSSDSWPRIVEDIKHRNRHSIVSLCTPEGSLQKVILTKAKNNDGSYTVVRSSLWGDSVPLIIKEFERDNLTAKERKRLKELERSNQENQNKS